MKKLARYRNLIVMLGVTVGALLIRPEFGQEAVRITGYSLREMLMILPPVFILLGLLDVWVPRQTFVKYMGEGSGIRGIVMSFLIGSAAAGPLYGAFPVAAVFMKKGVSFFNIMIFIGAWSTTKIPMILFEVASLGSLFAITRLLVNIPGIIIIAYILMTFTSDAEREEIYERAEEMAR
jgi:uncharacterized membrane protein YraQ (UPF0718 family)